MIAFFAQAKPDTPEIDFAALSLVIALIAGLCVVLMVGLLRSRFARRTVAPALTILTLATTIGLGIWQWGRNVSIVAESLRIDDLALAITFIVCAAGIATVVLALRAEATREAGEGEWYAMLLTAILGMVVLAASQDLLAMFIGYELLSIPLYVLCATHLRREHSL